MFALMTVIWILSVTFTVQFIDSLNKSVALCHGSNSDSFCVHSEVAAIQVRTSLSADAWLVMLFDIPLVNVSIKQYRVLALYPHILRASPVN